MTESHKNLETTRIETSLGTLIVISHPNGVRVALAYSQAVAPGKVEWRAQCIDFYGQGVPPITGQAPQTGTSAGLDDLERELAEEAAAPMQTDYWSDR